VIRRSHVIPRRCELSDSLRPFGRPNKHRVLSFGLLRHCCNAVTRITTINRSWLTSQPCAAQIALRALSP